VKERAGLSKAEKKMDDSKTPKSRKGDRGSLKLFEEKNGTRTRRCATEAKSQKRREFQAKAQDELAPNRKIGGKKKGKMKSN